ncbi:TetR/AcrR family transcriptional regulator [Streptomyces sp. NPDC002588]|uniref:TetR/AcrR family transcriptional regulator n=1 Tax=Streptomyces sp. NPDC002588 TaxID=3154419 RepID=UPI00332DA065
MTETETGEGKLYLAPVVGLVVPVPHRPPHTVTPSAVANIGTMTERSGNAAEGATPESRGRGRSKSAAGRRSPKQAADNSTRPTARRELVESEIFEQASRLFAERGFAGTNLRDIAEAMGVTRPALYYYVKSKEDLLAKLVAQMTEGPAAEIEALAKDDSLDPATKLRRIAHLIAFQRATQPSRFQLLLRSEADLPPAAAKAHTTGMRAALTGLMHVMEEGVLKGQFRPVDARSTALAVAGMCNWVAWWHHPGDTHHTDAEVAEQVSDLAVAMVIQPDDRTPEISGPKAALALLRQDLDYLERILDA